MSHIFKILIIVASHCTPMTENRAIFADCSTLDCITCSNNIARQQCVYECASRCQLQDLRRFEKRDCSEYGCNRGYTCINGICLPLVPISSGVGNLNKLVSDTVKLPSLIDILRKVLRDIQLFFKTTVICMITVKEYFIRFW